MDHQIQVSRFPLLPTELGDRLRICFLLIACVLATNTVVCSSNSSDSRNSSYLVPSPSTTANAPSPSASSSSAIPGERSSNNGEVRKNYSHQHPHRPQAASAPASSSSAPTSVSTTFNRYPGDSLQNDQTCPDITTESNTVLDEAVAGKFPSRLIMVNLPKQRSNPHNNQDIPCNFKVKGPSGKIVTNIGVRGIHHSRTPWDFDQSEACPSFVKFRITESHVLSEKEVRQPEIICRIWKASLSQQQPKLFHPVLWYYPRRKVGITFTSPAAAQSPPEAEENPKSKSNYYKFLQIVFTVSTGQSCSIRVQQYLIDQNGNACNVTEVPSKFRTCGEYRCADHIHRLNQLGAWTYVNWGMNGFIRRRTYWFTAVVRTSIVPVLFFGMIFLGYKFFCVLYPSYPVLSERRARSAYNQSAIRAFNGIPIDASNLRENLTPRRSTPRHLNLSEVPDSGLFPGNMYQDSMGGRGGPGNIPTPDDPPPTYESLSPPSYTEATKV